MDRSEVEAIVGREAPRLVRLLGLEHWKIRYRFDPYDDGMAYSDRRWAYRSATIGLDPAQHDSEADVLDSLEHELVHLILAPLDAYRSFSLPTYPKGTPEAGREDVTWHFAAEQAVGNIQRLLANSRRMTMPTKKGYSKKAIGDNIKAEKAAGMPQKQAVAVALNIAREAAKKAGKPGKAPKKKGK